MKRYTKPIHLPKPLAHRPADSSLALINVVFLLLLFLLIAGTLRPPLPEDFEWAETKSEDGRGDIQGSLVLTRSGETWIGGTRFDAEGAGEFLQGMREDTDRLSIQVDRRAKIEDIANLADQLRVIGFRHLTLVTIEAEQP